MRAVTVAVVLATAAMTVAVVAAPTPQSRPSQLAAKSVPASAWVAYRPPVDAPVTDPFRPPAQRWGAGNRGVEYGTQPGTRVRAAGAGVVSFAGQVGGTLHVTVAHRDGVRTSYSFLASISVRRGQTVRGGQVVGITGERRLHFGARRGTAYFDPLSLFTDRYRVRLVPARRG
ncbi:MAG: murein hydrolase activator EnvC family protein [Acidimicrobiales bacterium]